MENVLEEERGKLNLSHLQRLNKNVKLNVVIQFLDVFQNNGANDCNHKIE